MRQDSVSVYRDLGVPIRPGPVVGPGNEQDQHREQQQRGVIRREDPSRAPFDEPDKAAPQV